MESHRLTARAKDSLQQRLGMVRFRLIETFHFQLTRRRWLSIVWQFFWSWIYAPYTLWKARNIHDAHGWRTQTILVCIAG